MKLSPDYQRNEIWQNDKNTAFIESLYMGIIVPPIYVVEIPGADILEDSTSFAPPFGTPQTVIFCRFLHSSRKQKLLISFGNQKFTVFCFSSKWCHRESNQGHKDFQSFALPTELWHRCLIASANVRVFFNSARLSVLFLFILFRIYFRRLGEILFCFCFCLKQRYIIMTMNGNEAKGTAGCARNHTGIAIASSMR